MNDEDSATYNRWNNYAASVYDNDNYQGTSVCTSRGFQRSSYTSNDDRHSSHKAPVLSATC